MKRFLIACAIFFSFQTSFAQNNEIPNLPNDSIKSGLYSSKGKKLFPCIYEEIFSMPDELFGAKQDGMWGVVDKKGKIIVPFLYDAVRYYARNFIVVESNNKNAVLDIKTGRDIIPFKYEYIGTVSNGLSVVCLNGKWGAINTSGVQVITCKYGYIEPFRQSYSLATDTVNYNWGVINYAGNELSEFNYTEIQDYPDLSIAIAKKGSKVGILRPSDGMELIPCENNDLYPPKNNIIRVVGESKWGAYYVNGANVIPFEYNFIDEFVEGYARVLKNQDWGVIDEYGTIILPFEYKYITNVNEGLAIVKQKSDQSMIGVIDLKTKNTVVPFEYIKIEPFSNGIASARKKSNNKWGIIDKKGVELCPFEFTSMGAFDKGVVPAYDKLWGIVDKHGKIKAPHIYSEMNNYSGDVTLAIRDRKYYVINRRGKEVLGPYDKMEATDRAVSRAVDFHNGIIIAYKNEKKGIVNSKGKEIVPCEYDEIQINEDKTYTVRKYMR